VTDRADEPCPTQSVQDALDAVLESIMRPLVTLPRWKFLIEAVSGIIRCRTLIQRDIACVLDEMEKAPGTVERRLGAHLNDPVLADVVNTGLLRHAAPRVQVYTPIAIDLTDTQRRHAWKTPGVEGNYERTVRNLADALGGSVGIDVMDRGMDSQRCFGCELQYRRWFLVRLCDRRRKLPIPGLSSPVYPADAVSHMAAWHTVRCRSFDKTSRSWKQRKCQITWCTTTVAVEYPNGTTEDRQFTFIVARRGRRTMFLLTNLTIDDGLCATSSTLSSPP